MKGISVILCCYNSANRIEDTIFHLSKQAVPINFNWEIILVNNASTDDTAKVANDAWKTVEPALVPFKMVNEPVSGQIHARKRGIQQAKYDLLIFCDDDNWFYPDYIYNAYLIHQEYPELGIYSPPKCFGIYQIPPPKWFLKRKHMVAVYEVDLQKTAASPNENVFCGGAGMYMNRSFGHIYIHILANNNIRQILGRRGNSLISGDDTDLNYIAYQAGYKTGIFNQLKLEHYITKERISRVYMLRLKYAMAYSHTLISYLNNIQTYNWTLLGFIKNLTLTLLHDPFEALMIVYAFAGFKKAKKLIKISGLV